MGNWLIVGGGGGITSEFNPDDSPHGRDQYGFMDVALSKTQMKLEAINERGEVRHTEVIYANKYPPVLIDEAKALAKEALQKKKVSNAAAQKLTIATAAAEK